jgi:hypothetical protein
MTPGRRIPVRMNSDSFITSSHHASVTMSSSSSVILFLTLESVFNDLLPSNGSFVALRCSGNVSLPKRCLANSCIPSEYFHRNPSSHTMALGSTQTLTEMSTSDLPVGKGPSASA